MPNQTPPQPTSRPAPAPGVPRARAASLVGALAAAALLACGGSKKAPEDASAAYEPQSEIAWKDMSREQRMDWMGLAVFPRMRQLFREQDPEKYEDFSCQTCHGERMEIVDFEMPSELFALEKDDTIAQARQYDEPTTDFMVAAVVPAMARLLQMDPDNVDPRSEAGCLGCHPTSR